MLWKLDFASPRNSGIQLLTILTPKQTLSVVYTGIFCFLYPIFPAVSQAGFLLLLHSWPLKEAFSLPVKCLLPPPFGIPLILRCSLLNEAFPPGCRQKSFLLLRTHSSSHHSYYTYYTLICNIIICGNSLNLYIPSHLWASVILSMKINWGMLQKIPYFYFPLWNFHIKDSQKNPLKLELTFNQVRYSYLGQNRQEYSNVYMLL